MATKNTIPKLATAKVELQPKEKSMQLIGTPTLPGYIPDRVVVGGEKVTPNDLNKEYIVTFKLNMKPTNNAKSKNPVRGSNY